MIAATKKLTAYIIFIIYVFSSKCKGTIPVR